MAQIDSYRDLQIWQRSMDLAVACYEVSRQLPDSESYGLCSQIRRAATSIPANIAEGHGRELPGSFIQHLRISQGSLKELETLLLLAQRLEMVEQPLTAPLLAECSEVGRMIRALIRAIQTKE
jgi:four helix bundle protein